MIVNCLNKYVTEMSEETHKNRNDKNWRQCRETCCESKTETNINANAFSRVFASKFASSALVNSNMGELFAKWMVPKREFSTVRARGWGPQGRSRTVGGELARVPNLHMCRHPCSRCGTRRGERAN